MLPYLRQRNGNRGIIRRRVLRTIGIGESTIDHELGRLMERSNPTVGLAAHLGQADVRVTAQAQTEDEVEALLDGIEAEVRARIGRTIYSATADEPFAEVVARMLEAQGATVALFETNTAGKSAAASLPRPADFTPLAAVWTADDLSEAPAALQDLYAGLAPPFDEALSIGLARVVREVSGATYGLALIGTSGDDEGVWGSGRGRDVDRIGGPGREDSVQRINYGGRERATSVRIRQHRADAALARPRRRAGVVGDGGKPDAAEAISLVTLLDRANDLKRLPRMGWLLAGVAPVESVAEHSFGVAFLSLAVGRRHQRFLGSRRLDRAAGCRTHAAPGLDPRSG